GVDTLRYCVQQAQPGDTIQFSGAINNQTITLTTGEIAINKDLTIQAWGQAVTVSGGNSSRIFDVTAGNVTFNHLKLTGGKVSGNVGGAIFVGDGASVTVNASDFTNNQAASQGDTKGYGGAIANG